MTTQELLDVAAWIHANRPDVWDKVAGGQHPVPKGEILSLYIAFVDHPFTDCCAHLPRSWQN